MSSEAITQNDLTEILNNVLPPTNTDYVVSQGTSDFWTYRKWNSGIAECWGTKTASIAGVSKTAPFSGYCFAFGVIAYPTGLFASGTVPTAVVSGRIDTNYNCVCYSNCYDSGVSTELQSNTSGTRNCYAYIHAYGTWK